VLNLPCIALTASHPILNVLSLRTRARRTVFRDPPLHPLVDKEDQVVELTVWHQLLAHLQLNHASTRLHGL
jgi:hypothetical protein